jgi:hypothetical protein
VSNLTIQTRMVMPEMIHVSNRHALGDLAGETAVARRRGRCAACGRSAAAAFARSFGRVRWWRIGSRARRGGTGSARTCLIVVCGLGAARGLRGFHDVVQ